MNWPEPSSLKIDPFGILVGHTWAEVGLLFEMINRLGVKTFVEIGVHKGGLAAMLESHARYNADFQYMGVEINESIVEDQVKREIKKSRRCQLVFADALEPLTIRIVGQFLNDNLGPAFIYCDGGDKTREFKYYPQLLRPGDFIAAHDYDYGNYARAEISQQHVRTVMEYENLGLVMQSAPYRIIVAIKGVDK